MLLVTFNDSEGTRIGVLDRESETVIDLARADPSMPRSLHDLIAMEDAGRIRLRTAAASKEGRLPLSSVRLMAPFPRPLRNVICVGKNYSDHVKEFQKSGFDTAAKADIPSVPIFFTKATTTVTGPGDAIPASSDPTDSVDYEGELAVVIGRRGRSIRREDAPAHVFGYTIVNDVTSRTLQHRHLQWFLGKSLDGFCPMGPAVLTADEVPDPAALRVTTRVNGELRQDAPVSDLIFDIPTLIATLSSAITLEPGDVIATGTPAGVGAGFKPPKFLKPGDRVAVTIHPIGTLENPVA